MNLVVNFHIFYNFLVLGGGRGAALAADWITARKTFRQAVLAANLIRAGRAAGLTAQKANFVYFAASFVQSWPN